MKLTEEKDEYGEIKWLLVMFEIMKQADPISARLIIGSRRFKKAMESAIEVLRAHIMFEKKDIKTAMDFSEQARQILKSQSWKNKSQVIKEVLQLSWADIKDYIGKDKD